MSDQEAGIAENREDHAFIELIMAAQVSHVQLLEAQTATGHPAHEGELKQQLEQARAAAWAHYLLYYSTLIRQVVGRYLSKYKDFDKVREHYGELIQDALVRTFTALLAQEDPHKLQNLRGWMRVVLLNVTKQNIARMAKDKRRFVPMPMPGEANAAFPGSDSPTAPDPKSGMSERDLIDVMDQPLLLRVLRVCLEHLSPEAFQVVAKRLEPRTFEQIALEHERDTTWAWRTYQAALKMLQKCFRSRGILEP